MQYAYAAHIVKLKSYISLSDSIEQSFRSSTFICLIVSTREADGGVLGVVLCSFIRASCSRALTFGNFDLETSFLMCMYIFRESIGPVHVSRSSGQGRGHSIIKLGHTSVTKYTHLIHAFAAPGLP